MHRGKHSKYLKDRELKDSDKVELDPHVQKAIMEIVQRKTATALILQPHIMEYVYQARVNGKTLVAIAKDLKVSKHTIYQWSFRFPAFKKLLDEANRVRASQYIDEMIEIADDVSEDKIITDNGIVRPNAANVARSKLKIQTRRKVAAIYDPANYGEIVDGGSRVNINGDVFMGLQITPPTSSKCIENDCTAQIVDKEAEKGCSPLRELREEVIDVNKK